ncbi:putative NBD/HSP70 family sugar kinase [Motilibacter peucedani]|uniref:Putative NBD/HSP70 family sugar kinase n=1 Tax=Motilibacter peucedani TaxID=598650 RepID=A0A420XQ01_9ACTN|nr:ROK family transcriptional regulator [Motilibacter peucedani]RKS75324.1 putative NBD/HSP70 family sugar kinase [Motilibacter peucedani]
MSATKPSLALLRSLSDEHVLHAVMTGGAATRAQLATATGLSKPTVSQSVQRLADAGVLRDTGDRTTGRGGVGVYYALADELGTALAVSIAPGSVVVESLDAYGHVLRTTSTPLTHPVGPDEVARGLASAAGRASVGLAPVRTVSVSAADPVDRTSGRLVHLPDAPFLVGELDPVAVLSDVAAGAVVTVDNDVNWAARAERDARTGAEAQDFVYLYLGEGVGLGVVSDGEVRRGFRGFAGEVAHVVTTGPDGSAMAFTEVFRDLDLRLPDSSAIDVTALVAIVHAGGGGDRGVTRSLGRAVAGVVAAAVALLDPAWVVVGGPWGSDEAVFRALGEHVRRLTRPVTFERARQVRDASLTGARHQALADLRAGIVAEAAARD